MILESLAQVTFTDPLSMIKALPESFGNASPRFKTEPCVLNPVVAPQFRENRTIFLVPPGDITSAIGSLEHSVPKHPAREKSATLITKERIIFQQDSMAKVPLECRR